MARLHRTPRALRSERGAAMVEMSFAAGLLLMLLLGIVSYGILLSFKQGMTQVAAEAARAAAVPGPLNETPGQLAEASFTAAAERILQRTCDPDDGDGLRCTATEDCSVTPCRLNIEVVYDNAAKPLVPPIPLLSSVLPKTVRATSSVQVP